MTFASSIVFNVDIFNDNMNLGFMPFVMLLIYGVVSVVYVCVSGKISKMYSTGHEDTEVRENTCPFKDL